jgi:hypothetical protein
MLSDKASPSISVGVDGVAYAKARRSPGLGRHQTASASSARCLAIACRGVSDLDGPLDAIRKRHDCLLM